MEAVTVAIEGKFGKDGARDIDLVVHSFYVGHPSPCVVIEDGVNRGLIGGQVDTLDEIFQLELSRHPGYIVKERSDVVLIKNSQTEKTDPDKEQQPE